MEKREREWKRERERMGEIHRKYISIHSTLVTWHGKQYQRELFSMADLHCHGLSDADDESWRKQGRRHGSE